MSMDWFRSWHGAPTDPKWLLIAKRSETQAGIVSAIVWALFDHGSQNSDDRGNVETFDTETYAAFSGFEEIAIQRVIECLKDKSIIVDGYLSAWEKRQTKREDNSTPRVQKHRNAKKHKETLGNDREEKTIPEKIDSEANASGASAPADDPSEPEREYFARGRKVLGKSAGGQLAKLLKANGGNVSLSRSTLELAATKFNPAEFFARAIAPNAQGPPTGKGGFTHVLMEKHQERQNGTVDSEPEFYEH